MAWGQLDKAAAETCICAVTLCLAAVMAGSGHLQTMRLIRSARRTSPGVRGADQLGEDRHTAASITTKASIAPQSSSGVYLHKLSMTVGLLFRSRLVSLMQGTSMCCCLKWRSACCRPGQAAAASELGTHQSGRSTESRESHGHEHGPGASVHGRRGYNLQHY